MSEQELQYGNHDVLVKQVGLGSYEITVDDGTPFSVQTTPIGLEAEIRACIETEEIVAYVRHNLDRGIW